MHLTALGANAAQLGDNEKRPIGQALVRGDRAIDTYTHGVCYETVAFVRYLLGAAISPDDLANQSGNDFRDRFNFQIGTEWQGEAIEAGRAVGFFRVPDRKVFHAAISTGGVGIRAVNGGRLGLGWEEVNLHQVLGKPNGNGTYSYDGAEIRVYISNL